MPGYPTSTSVTVSDVMATIDATIGNVAKKYVWLVNIATGVKYGPSAATDSSGNWSLASVDQGIYETFYAGESPAGVVPTQWTTAGVKGYMVSIASNPASTLAASVSTPTGHTALTGGGLDGSIFDTGGFAINVRGAAYGALAALVTDPDGAITSGTAILTSPFHVFTSAMVGWNVLVQNAGGAGGVPLVTTILSYQNIGQVTLNANAAATVSDGEFYAWPASGAGADDAAAINLAQVNAGISGAIIIPSAGRFKGYPVSALNILDQGQTVVGAAMHGTTLLHTGAGTLLQTGHVGVGGGGVWNKVSGLRLVAGQNTTDVLKILDGQHGHYWDLELDGLAVQNSGNALTLTGATLNAGGSYYNLFEQIHAHHAKINFNINANSNGSNLNNNNTFVQCRGGWGRDANWYFNLSQGVEMFGCDAEQAGKLGAPTDATWGYSLVLVNAQDIHWIGGWVEGNLNGTVNIKTGRIDGFVYLPAASTGIAGANGFTGIPSQLGKRCEVLDMSANTPAYYTSKRRTLLGDFGAAIWTETLTTVTAGIPLITVASAAGAAGFNLPHGAAPSAPVNGDMWSTTAGLFIRINGVTKTVTLT